MSSKFVPPWETGASLTWEIHGTYWNDETFRLDTDPTTPPTWWVTTRKHYVRQLAALERALDKLIEQFDDEGRPKNLRSLLQEFEHCQLMLGRVQGALGPLPVGFIRYPPEFDRKLSYVGAASFHIENALKTGEEP